MSEIDDDSTPYHSSSMGDWECKSSFVLLIHENDLLMGDPEDQKTSSKQARSKGGVI